MNISEIIDVKNFILENINLLDIIENYGYKPKKETDGRYTMICPFHSEDTPSFKIYNNTYFCFGCGAGTNVIDFILNQENIKFIDVINRYKEKVDLTSDERLLDKIDKNFHQNKLDLNEYSLRSKYRLGIYLREYLKNNPNKVELVDSCFYDIDNYFSDDKMDKEKIDYIFEDIIQRIK